MPTTSHPPHHQHERPHPVTSDDHPAAASALAPWGAACAQCAAAKAKCLRSNPVPGAKCDRCDRLDKPCAEKLPKIRKKRQSKPSKTAQIEERLNGLVRLLQASGDLPDLPAVSVEQPGGHAPVAPRHTPISSRTDSPSSHNGAYSIAQSDASPFFHASPCQPSTIWIPDTYNCHGPPRCTCRPTPGQAPGPLDPDETLLSIYREHLMPVHPFVIIPKDVSAVDLAATRPFLMSCIRMVASFRSLRSMQAQMYRIMTHIADHMLIRSERSLDLLAGIIVILGWHHYHCTMHTQMHNLVSLAVTLAGELGLKRKPCWHERTRLMVMDLGAVRERTSEEKRLLLATWYLSSCVSTGFQQLDPMRFSPYMEQCLQELSQSQETASDEYLAQLIRIQKLAEKVSYLNLREEVDEGSDVASRAPLSGYVSVFGAELDSLRANMPASLRDNKLIRSHLSVIHVRLFEPPILDPRLLKSISDSLTTNPAIPGVPSHLDAFYRSNAALKAWYEDWLSIPTSMCYSLPISMHIDIIYVVTILGRWAKLAAPGAIHSTSTAPPLDPSGSYNNPSNDSNLPLSPRRVEIAQAVTALKTQLATQPGLELDVTGILGAMGGRLEQVSDLLAAGGSDPQAWERNIWARSAIKLKIAQLKLEQFAAMVAEEAGEEPDEENVGEGGMQEDYEGRIEMADIGGFGHAMDGWTDDIMANMGWPLPGSLYESVDPLLWAEAGGMT